MAGSLSRAAAPNAAELTLADLALGEQLVVWAVRKRLEGESRRATVRRGFALSGNGEDTYAAFEALFGVLAGHCRRDLWFHRCGCCRVSPDELAILGLVAARQAGDMASALFLGRSLLAAPALGEALRLADRLGRTLAERGLGLSLRCRYVPWQPDPERRH